MYENWHLWRVHPTYESCSWTLNKGLHAKHAALPWFGKGHLSSWTVSIFFYTIAIYGKKQGIVLVLNPHWGRFFRGQLARPLVDRGIGIFNFSENINGWAHISWNEKLQHVIYSKLKIWSLHYGSWWKFPIDVQK